jgi:hypothetical protein
VRGAVAGGRSGQAGGRVVEPGHPRDDPTPSSPGVGSAVDAWAAASTSPSRHARRGRAPRSSAGIARRRAHRHHAHPRAASPSIAAATSFVPSPRPP